MALYPHDVRYAFRELGLLETATLDQARDHFKTVSKDTFQTRSEIKRVKRLVDFLQFRSDLAPLATPFADVRRAYHRQAMKLHPDTNAGASVSDDELKALNAAFELIEAVAHEAEVAGRDKKSHATAEPQKTATKKPDAPDASGSAASSPGTTASARAFENDLTGSSKARIYMAATVPRNFRTSRLSYLKVQSVIGSHAKPLAHGALFVTDVIMLPEKEFARARAYLGAPDLSDISYNAGKMSAPYVVKDVQTLAVPADVADPEGFARVHFQKAFNLRGPPDET